MKIVTKMLQSLMPRGFAWQGRIDGDMAKLLEGLAEEYCRLRAKAYRLGSALFPQGTAYLDEWEFEFALPEASSLTEEDRRGRIDGRWAMISQGSMQSNNMEFIFSISGIDLVARPLNAGENPFEYFILDGQAFYGNLLAQYGRTRYGDTFPIATPDNQLLINGGSSNFNVDPADAGGLIPSDSDFWGMIYVLEGPNGEVLQLPFAKRQVLYDIIYATKPAHMWCILRVNFSSSFIFAPPGLSETRRIYWSYQAGPDTSIIHVIMDTSDPDWAEPASDYQGVAGSYVTYSKTIGFGVADPEANTFDGDTQAAGSGAFPVGMRITSLGGTNYEKINQGDYTEHRFYLTNAGTPTGTLSIEGDDKPSDALTPFLPAIEFDDVEKIAFDAVNPGGIPVVTIYR